MAKHDTFHDAAEYNRKVTRKNMVKMMSKHMSKPKKAKKGY